MYAIIKICLIILFISVKQNNCKLIEESENLHINDINDNIKSENLEKSDNFVKSKGNPFALVKNQKCSDDIKKICGPDISSLTNFAVLECIQNKERDDSLLINEECHHVLWSYKLNLTQSANIDSIVKQICQEEKTLLTQCSQQVEYGNTISCLIQNMDKISEEKCQQYILRLAAVVFSDYHLVQHMTEGCKKDIEKHECGRVQSALSTEVHSQGLTIECLSKHIGTLQPKCHQQILRLAELQSVDFRLDRALFFACREDRDHLCTNVRTGKGMVYNCLMKHKNDRTMSQDCAEQLSRRQNIISQDFQASRSLVKHCKRAIKDNQCRKGTVGTEPEIKLSKILLCLEGALHEGKIRERDCVEEILNHRQMLFDISPEVADKCKDEIINLCGENNNSGKLHCLMKIYKRKGQTEISNQCKVALEDLIQETDPAEDWRVDPVLYESCLPVVQNRCKNLKGGEGRIIRCLMRNINTQFMTDSCEAALLEIQYFVARDWKLDPQLYQSCKNDSIKLCNADHDWTNPFPNVPGADNSILVLPCLFRYTYHPSPDLRLSHQCSNEVRRVMHYRAAYVSLHPQIEMECLEPLAALCSEKTGPGDEMLCLQNNMERLEGICLQLVKNYTEVEARDISLNSLVTIHCSDVIEKLCSNEVHNDEIDEGRIMDCLIEHKNSQVMRDKFKCRAVVESFQIIMMKDILFTPKFKHECQESVRQFCMDSQNRKDVLGCLSQRMLKDILNEDRSSIPKGCKQQIRKQLTQRHESIELDPKLKRACHDDIETLCQSASGPGMVLECLRGNRKNLSFKCHEVVFQRENEESADPTTDVILLRNCREVIKRFCSDSEPENLFSCLMYQMNTPGENFNGKCRSILTQRMVERSKDYRLNPDLIISCKLDMKKYCKKELDNNVVIERNGKVIECLKHRLGTNRLTHKCEMKLIQITKNAALNYKLDPILNEKCSREIKILCGDVEGSEKGEVEECLKVNLEKNQITDDQCKVYIAEIMERERADIHADPLLLKACTIDDTKYCAKNEQGAHLACLFDVLDRNPNSLEKDCMKKLRQRREMFKIALKVSKLESVDELVESVRSSPQRNYFLIILFTIAGVIFIGGLVCGRASRRSYKLMKNR